MTDRNRQIARQLALAVQQQGGQVFYVGGLVRDRLLGLEGKDVDVEVHGVPAPQLEAILDGLGQRTQMGASFGIYGLKHFDIDIAMPRREQATGRGHKDFAVFTDPFLGPEKAAQRRDFTINAMMEDVLTGQIIDPYGGREDLKKGILRHVDDASFAEDPLRVLRCAQFAARFGFSVAPETKALCRRMDLSTLPGERILGELQKALLKSDSPSVFFEILRTMEQLDFWFPEVKNLIDVQQDSRFHPEGDVWTHTMLVLDQAAGLREQAKEPLNLMFAALCHDFGKAEVMQIEADGRIRAIGHEDAGIPLTERFVCRITAEHRLRSYCANMVLLHMRPNLMAGQRSGVKAFCRLYDQSCCPEDLLLLSKADALGCATGRDYTPTERFLQDMLACYRDVMSRPFVKGADLVALGFAPGKDFSEVLDYAHRLRLAGVEKRDALGQCAAMLRKLREI